MRRESELRQSEGHCQNLLASSSETRCIAGEREALLAFKRGLKDEHDVLSSWGSENDKEECCNWPGVQCSNTTGHVIALQNSYTGLRGEISPSLLELHHLSYLDLSYILIGGRIPKFMGSMKMLQYLYLVDCGLYDTDLQHLGNLTNLVALNLSSNSLRFHNLQWMSHLSSLSHLDLSLNNISDTTWPQQMLMLQSLKYLKLQQCNLSDGMSVKGFHVNYSSTSISSIYLSENFLTLATLDFLFHIRSLVRVDVSENQLDGLIPESITNLTFLEVLDLSDNKLKGGIHISLENLSHLNSLDLSHNDLRQPLVELIGNLSCKALEYLILHDNQLSGFVPEFRSFLMLNYLRLENNKLIRLPTSFGNLSRLELFVVSNNSLEGTISENAFTNLHSLKGLDLSFNKALHMSPNWNPPFQLDSLFLRYVKLGPEFPPWIQVLRNLTTLDISYTHIFDEAPNWLWNFSANLFTLVLSHNQIRGNIPAGIYLERLSNIDVSWNAFTGPLPLFMNGYIQVLQLSHNEFFGSMTSICNMKSSILIQLDVSYNQLSGKLPNCWENMSNQVSILNFANNKFSGGIPQSLGSIRSLRTLHLNDNCFSGELPSTLKNCTYLQLIDVGGNELTGNIPQWIGASYRYMVYLTFRDNEFHGSIPLEICKLIHIQVLDLSRNNLSGNVPKCLDNFTSLVQRNMKTEDGTFSSGIPVPIFVLTSSMDGSYVDYPYVSVLWKTNESKYQKTLWLLKLIDLSSNNLIGNIPLELFHLKGLISLNLSRNSLEGQIPQEIGHMEMLESLDLCGNNLSGAIPASLAGLHYLGVLNLSQNSLSGKIPTGTQLQSFNRSSYDGNPKLCGQPLPLCPGDELSPPPFNTKENDEDRVNWFENLSLMQGFCISMSVGFIFGFWGVIGSLVLKRSWRIAYFNFFGSIGDWMHLKITIFLAKF